MEKIKLPDWMDNHQKEGIAWILSRRNSYLAHCAGSGKTCQAIVAAEHTEGWPNPVLFIVPPTLTMNWKREIEKWTTKLGSAWIKSILIVPRTIERHTVDWSASYIICPDSMITKGWVLEAIGRLRPKFIAVDEASRFKEASAARTKALFCEITNQEQVKHVVLMDGSPMPNRPMELWAPTYALKPVAIDWMDQNEFGFKYCGASQNDYGQWEFKHSSNEAELKERLQKSFMHVVTEDEIKGHPERRRSILYMPSDVRSAHQKKWEAKHLSEMKIDGEQSSQGDLAEMRHELGLRKVKFIAEYVAERLKEKNESILLFAWHRSVVEKLCIELCEFWPLDVVGGTPAKVREEFFKRFQSGKNRLLIMNIAAGGRGHNLQRADRVIFGEFSWTGETNFQCEARAARKGRILPVRCEYIACPESLDEVVLKTLFRKEKTVRKVIG